MTMTMIPMVTRIEMFNNHPRMSKIMPRTTILVLSRWLPRVRPRSDFHLNPNLAARSVRGDGTQHFVLIALLEQAEPRSAARKEDAADVGVTHAPARNGLSRVAGCLEFVGRQSGFQRAGPAEQHMLGTGPRRPT